MAKIEKESDEPRPALDNPALPDQPSERRHAVYVVGVIAIGMVLNLLVMVALASGR